MEKQKKQNEGSDTRGCRGRTSGNSRDGGSCGGDGGCGNGRESDDDGGGAEENKQESLLCRCEVCNERSAWRDFASIPCGCVIHLVCLERWLVAEACPRCRGRIEPANVASIQLPEHEMVEGSDKRSPEAVAALAELEASRRGEWRPIFHGAAAAAVPPGAIAAGAE